MPVDKSERANMSVRYRLILGTKKFSSWSLRPWLAMKMAGLDFDEEVVRLRSPDTKANVSARSPSGKVPALIIEDGEKKEIVWDSLAICETLAERHPEIAFWPKDAGRRAEARAIVCEMHSGFADIRNMMPMDIGEHHPAPEMDETLEKQIARVKTIWSSALERYSEEGGFLFGEYSIADSFYAPAVTRFDTYGITLTEPLQNYSQRILALEPMREWAMAAKKEIAEFADAAD
jgi:glutathione S-transferase